MVDESRRWLIESLRKHLIPAFEARGFEVLPLAGEDARSLDIRTAFPFGRLHRATAQGIEMVEVQLDKYGNAAFRLNIGVSPLLGIEHQSGRVAPEDMWVHYLNHHFEVYSWPRFRRWFAVRRWFGPSASKTDYEYLVTENLGLVKEAEDALRAAELGQHIRVVEM